MSEIKYKIIVIGDAAVGKTSLIRKYTKGEFKEDYIATLGAQFTQYEEIIEGMNFKLIFWDIAGQPTFEKMRKKFYSGSSAAIIVFSHSPDERKSFKSVDRWLSEVREYCGNIKVVLFGNKLDLVNEGDLLINENLEICDSNIKQYTEKNGILGYYKTSALTGQGVNQAFNVIIKRIYSK